MPDGTLDVFISHSSKDKVIAGGLANLLVSTMHMPAKKIRCSSVQGFKFSGGDTLHHEIRRESIESKVFIGVISMSSLASTYVQFELGARWGANKKIKPFFCPGIERDILEGPLSDLLPIHCDSDSVLSLLEDIAKETGYSLQSMGFSNNAVKEFVNLCEKTFKSTDSEEEDPSDKLEAKESFENGAQQALGSNGHPLSYDAIELLKTIVISPTNCMVVGEGTLDDVDTRSKAKMNSLISELTKGGYIESLGGEGKVYEPTDKGFRFYDELQIPSEEKLSPETENDSSGIGQSLVRVETSLNKINLNDSELKILDTFYERSPAKVVGRNLSIHIYFTGGAKVDYIRDAVLPVISSLVNKGLLNQSNSISSPGSGKKSFECVLEITKLGEDFIEKERNKDIF
ncbi:hypothetical protein Pan153_22540 [Gimesia panareensis]|uniref:TIR domain-containing protein n=1 Tax=Gimesia panareensis TaxID=2527978 RepID=A0A518FMM2_9PLAN|nr:toll/interleukin-1 receptor domain-containing protein [Gimesia panareensis]QDV17601.1 hypothetical protein Pan153_22540 [Gimesia panareensis]